MILPLALLLGRTSPEALVERGIEDHTVDFRFAPPRSFSLICFPDDWQKTVVTESGGLGYDFGPGPYAQPLTTVELGVLEDSLELSRQWLEDPTFPAPTTILVGSRTTSRQRAFALLPERMMTPTGRRSDGKVLRTGGLNGCRGWATPPVGFDPAFQAVAWGTNRPIQYSIRVQPGSRKQVALGFCESYKTRPGSRLVKCRVEGSSDRIIDPLRRGPSHPTVELFQARDVDKSGSLLIEIDPVAQSDPNVILNVFWVFPDSLSLSPDALLSGSLSHSAEVYHDCGVENEETVNTARRDALLATFTGSTWTPVARIHSRRPLRLDTSRALVLQDERPFLLLNPKPLRMEEAGTLWTVVFPVKAPTVQVVALHGELMSLTKGLPNLSAEEKGASHFWHTQTVFPHPTLAIPDHLLQYLLQINLRNLYQVREVVDGVAQFQPGPSEGCFHFQRPSGEFQVMVPVPSVVETPVFLFTMCWYASASGDSGWLNRNWSILRRGFHWIEEMRRKTLVQSGAPFAGLMPPGFVDGGVAYKTTDYGSVEWAMTALERGSDWARRLGHDDDASRWNHLLQGFHDSFTAAAQRDLRQDRFGTTYLPITVDDTLAKIPQRGQYAFLIPLRYGRFFLEGSPLMQRVVCGTLAMLDSSRIEGLIANSGWMEEGLWPWLTCAQGLAHQVLGDWRVAGDILYDVANHASPAGTWVEEQSPQSKPSVTSGDGSNAEASALFLHLLRNTLLLERKDTLVCLASLPLEWLHPGALLAARRAITEYGRVTLLLQLSERGDSAHLSIETSRRPRELHTLRVDLRALRAAGFRVLHGRSLPEELTYPFGRSIKLEFHRIP
jgi:hypothetical protein